MAGTVGLDWEDLPGASYCKTYPPDPPDLPFWSVSCSHLSPSSCWLCHPSPPAQPIPPSSYTSSLLSLPSELHLAIFRHLSTLLDVSSLSATCRSLRYVLQSSPTSVLRPVLARSIHAYPDALRAARACVLDPIWPGCHFDLVTNTYNSPPTASFCANLAVAPATLAETTNICKLAALVRCWQSIWESSDLIALSQEIGFITDTPGAEERFHRGCYRVLLMGYLFTGVFLQRPSPDNKKARRRYPMFNLDTAWKTEQLLKLVGGFMEWIISDGADRWRLAGLRSLECKWYPDESEPNIIPPLETVKTIDGTTRGSLNELMLLFTVLDEVPLLLGIEHAISRKIGPPTSRFGNHDRQPTVDVRIFHGAYAYTVAVPRLHCIPATRPPGDTDAGDHDYAPDSLTFIHIALKHYFRLRISDFHFTIDFFTVTLLKREAFFIRTGGVADIEKTGGQVEFNDIMWPLEHIW